MKYGIHVGAGVIDSDYRGNLGVLLFNLGDQHFSFKEGDRIAQLVVKTYEHVSIENVDDISDTNRGENGFGSSGK